MADVISNLRLVTLLPTENQTIYAFNVNNPKEYYTESFFAKMGTTWAFCVVPDRTNNVNDYYINILQSNNQTIVLHAIIPDTATATEFRAGILNYYSTNSIDKYTYTISYQNIRIFATAVEKTRLDVQYKFINPIQSDHQLILIVNDSNSYYSYGVDLPVGSRWKAVIIAEAGYIPGNLIIENENIHEETVTEQGTTIIEGKKELGPDEIYESYVDADTTVSAKPATEKYTLGTMKVGLFDTSTIDHSNSDGYIRIGVGTDTNKEVKTILLYNRNKVDGDGLQIGTDPNNLLYAALGSRDDYNATRLVFNTNSRKRYVITNILGYYGYDYILGYSEAISGSSLTPITYTNGTVNITIKAFGFCAKQAPVNDATVGYYFLIIDNPSDNKWTYIKFMMYDNDNKVFTINAYKDYFTAVEDDHFIGQLIFLQGSKNGINDDIYLFLKDKLESRDDNRIKIGVYVY